MPPHSLPGLTALITGAGSGIGRATSVLLAREGIRLALAGRREAPLRETARLAEAARGPANPTGEHATTILQADIADPAQAQSLVDRAAHALGRLDILINCAGSAPMTPIAAQTIDLIRNVFDVNAVGPAASIVQAWPIFERQQSGCIINISSFSSVDPFPGLSIYGAAKAALNLLAKGCANEGRAFGLRAFAIAPGAVETPLLRSIFPESALPRDKTLPPTAIAEVILACIRGDHDDRNGQTILVPSP